MKRALFAVIVLSAVFSPLKADAEVIEIKVSGLVCDFCARTIQKSLIKTGKVEDVQVNLDKGEVFIQTKPDVLMSDEEIKKSIIDSGYNPLSINRN